MTNSLNFCLFWKILVALSFIDESFAGYSIWFDSFLSHVGMSPHCLLDLSVSDEKSTVKVIGDLLKVI